MFKLTKKKVAGLVVAGSLAVGAPFAYSYWTTTGEGDGEALAATESGTLVLHAHFDDGIYPGGAVDVTFTADNASDTNLWVETITLDSVEASDLDCVVADFTMNDVTSQTMVAAGASGAALTGTGSLVFANSNVSQDDCKGATITLNVSSD